MDTIGQQDKYNELRELIVEQHENGTIDIDEVIEKVVGAYQDDEISGSGYDSLTRMIEDIA